MTGANGRPTPATATLRLGGALPGQPTRVEAPEPERPFWREPDGSRHSYGTLRCGLDPRSAERLRRAHLAAIGRLAAAALEAASGGDHAETLRLATAAGRLCEEIAGRWSPAAVALSER